MLIPDCGIFIEHTQGLSDKYRHFVRVFGRFVFAESFGTALDGVQDSRGLFFGILSPTGKAPILGVSMGDMGSEKSSGGGAFSGGGCLVVYTGAGAFNHVPWRDIDGFPREKEGGSKTCGQGKCPGLFELASKKNAGKAPSLPYSMKAIWEAKGWDGICAGKRIAGC